MKRNLWVVAVIAASFSTSAFAKNKESFCTEGTVIAWGPGIHSRDALGSYPDTLVLETKERLIYLYNWTYGRNYNDRLFLRINSSLSFCIAEDQATFVDSLKKNQTFKVEHIEPK